MTDADMISIRMRLSGGQEVAAEAKIVSKEISGIGDATTASGLKTTRATTGISKSLGRVKTAWSAITRVAKVAAIGGAAGLALLGMQAKSSVESLLDLSTTTAGLHRNLGLTVEDSSRWASVAKSRDIDAKSLNMSFKTLSTNLVQAKTGSKTALAAFNAVGISQKDLAKSGGDFNSTLTLMAKRFGAAKGGADRQAAAGKLLGRGYQALLPLFADGAKGLQEQLHWADKYHTTLSGPMVDANMKLVKSQRESKVAWQGIQNVLGEALIPTLLKADAKFQDFAAELTDPRLSNDERISLISDKIRDAMQVSFDWIVNIGLPNLAGRVGQEAPKIAAGFATGFIKANVWGKLFMSAWLANKLLTGAVKGELLKRAMLIGAAAASRLWESTTILRARLLALAAAEKIAVAAQWLLNIAMDANPVVLIVIGIAALAAALVLAYMKVKWFHKAVDAAWSFIKSHWKLLAAIFLAPLAPLILLASHFGTIKKIGQGAFNGVKTAVHWVGDAVQFVIDKVTGLVGKLGEVKDKAGEVLDAAIPGGGHGIASDQGLLGIGGVPVFGKGGVMPKTGVALVGDTGPELVKLPGGSQVYDPPTSRSKIAGAARKVGRTNEPGNSDAVAEWRSRGSGGGLVVKQPIIFRLKGKTLAEAVVTLQADEEARQ